MYEQDIAVIKEGVFCISSYVFRLNDNKIKKKIAN